MAKRMSKATYKAFTRLIGKIAADVHEMHTLNEHIDSLPSRDREKVREEVLLAMGYAGSGYTDPARFLDRLHWYMGIPHLDLVRDFQRWASPRDPDLDDEGSDLYQHGALYSRHRAQAAPEPKREPAHV